MLILYAESMRYWQVVVSRSSCFISRLFKPLTDLFCRNFHFDLVQTIIPSFAAAFVSEALRITWQVSKMTYSNSLTTFTDYDSITRHQLLNSQTEQKDRKKTLLSRS
jgi:hypothetical protein